MNKLNNLINSIANDVSATPETARAYLEEKGIDVDKAIKKGVQQIKLFQKPIRVKRQYYKKLPPKSKSVTRPGRWGNPFKVIPEDGSFFVKDKDGNYWDDNLKGYSTKEKAAVKAVQCFRGYLAAKVSKGDLLLSDFDEIDNIACFCKLDETCHGDVIIDFIKKYRSGQTLF